MLAKTAIAATIASAPAVQINVCLVSLEGSGSIDMGVLLEEDGLLTAEGPPRPQPKLCDSSLG
jgi:hypothetical protein